MEQPPPPLEAGRFGKRLNSSQEHRFGPLALELEARLCVTEAGSRLRFLAAALAEEEAELLRAHIDPDSADSELWQLDPGVLFELEASSAAFDCLRASASSGARPASAPQLMGILNVTPDSFSDGGLHQKLDAAVAGAHEMIAAGAHWIDVGGESTRPGAQPVPLEEELARVLPVIEALRREGIEQVSIDTRHAPVAAAALEAGASLVNDVGAGLDDEGMLAVVRDAGCPWVLMHRQGTPEDMQRAPVYADAVADIASFLRRRVAQCLESGIQEAQLLVDPGVGFGKRLEHNLDLLGRLGELRSLGLPLLLGPSRKSFIGHVTGAEEQEDWQRRRSDSEPSARLGGTAAAITFCVLGGAEILRVHDVAIMAEAAAIADAVATRPRLSLPWLSTPAER